MRRVRLTGNVEGLISNDIDLREKKLIQMGLMVGGSETHASSNHEIITQVPLPVGHTFGQEPQPDCDGGKDTENDRA